MKSPILINRNLRLPIEQFYVEAFPKKKLFLHHSVSGSVMSVFKWWLSNPERVGTAYAIDKDGAIYEFFDPRYWCHHLGLNHKRNIELNQQSIGIEIISEGALTMKDSNLFAFDGKQIVKGNYVDNEVEWRGYRYFDAYEPAQIDSLYILCEYLCEQFSIPKQAVPQSEANLFDEKFFDFNGIIAHKNVRSDKTDTHPLFRNDHLQAVLDGAERGESVPKP
jgi:hypothetical protein